MGECTSENASEFSSSTIDPPLKIQPKLRTIVEFKDFFGRTLQSVSTEHTIPNVVVGHDFAFDHPMLDRCLKGKVTRINHVVFLSTDPPLTYIDVEVR